MEMILNHLYTPPELAQINENLSALLHDDECDQTLLQKYVLQRENLVNTLLNSLDQQQRKLFAEHEKQSNDFLLEKLRSMQNKVAEDLSKVTSSAKAIKHYHQT